MLNSLLKFTDSVHKIGKMKDSIRIGLLGGLIGAITIDLSNLLTLAMEWLADPTIFMPSKTIEKEASQQLIQETDYPKITNHTNLFDQSEPHHLH